MAASLQLPYHSSNRTLSSIGGIATCKTNSHVQKTIVLNTINQRAIFNIVQAPGLLSRMTVLPVLTANPRVDKPLSAKFFAPIFCRRKSLTFQLLEPVSSYAAQTPQQGLKMNVSTETSKGEGLSLTQSAVGLLRHYLGGRRGLVVLAVTAGAGMYLGWGWLAAAGIAPLLVAFAPCAVMCALGLCMSKGGGKSCSADSNTANPTPDNQKATEAIQQDEKR